MKKFMLTWLAIGLSTTTLLAQSTAPAAGKITYEVMRQVDRSQMRGFGPGGGGGGAPAPDGDNSNNEPIVMNYTQKLVFAGTMAKEERDRQQGGQGFRRPNGDGPPNGAGGPGGNRPAGMRMFPMEQQTYLDLANKKRLEVMTVKKDSMAQTYVSERPLPAATDWQETGKTKKIAGYECHKATAVHRKVPYTIWYTTDLPLTYSPVADLTPPKGVVMLIESDTESFKATGVSMESVAEASVMPPKGAKPVSQDEMEQLRRKAMADFRQQMMQNGGGFPPRN